MVNKPLPALPDPTLTTLSVEARDHRARLIQHFLSEIHEPRIEIRRDGWLHALEEALDDLSQHFSRGDWLSSIRRGRELKRRTLSSDPVIVEGDHKHKEGQHDKPLPASPDEPLKKLRLLNTRSSPPTEPRAAHLVLCVAPHTGRVSIPTEASGFDIVPTNIGCAFSGGSFSLQQDGADSTILYGLDGLRELDVEQHDIRLVGGTFTFKGVDSPVQHHLLSTVLRLSIYVHLSLLLEQYLLSDSRVPINFPRPVPTHSPSAPIQSPPLSPVVELQPPEPKPRSRSSIFPPNFMNSFIRRSLSFRSKTSKAAETPIVAAHRIPFERGLHRFSFLGEKRSPTRRHPHTPHQDVIRKPFEATLHRVQESVNLLSTSTGVRLKPPKILVDLADKEKATQSRMLMTDERTALNSLLGWDGKDAEGKGMSGTLGFVRYQELSVLRSQHIPPLPPEADGASIFTTSSSTFSNLPTTGLSLCGKPSWTTYRYYSSGDEILGRVICDLARSANLPCERPGCLFTRGQHEKRIIHGGTRIVIRTSTEVGDEGSKDDLIKMWQSCAVCEAKTPRTDMHDGTFLFSFAKFLELLVYSSTIGTLNSFLCAHTTPSKETSPDVPASSSSRLNIIRHFSTASCDVSFALSTIEDIFELKVPRLQITRGTEKTGVPLTPLGPNEDEGKEDEASQKKDLRREIKKWWEGVADHIDKIEKVLEREDTVLTQKTLPRLPSIDDDAYDAFHHSSGSHTPTSSAPQGLPPPPPTPSSEVVKADGEEILPATATASESSTASTINNSSPSESILYASPAHTPSIISTASTTTTTTTPPMASVIITDIPVSQPPTPLKDNSEQLLMTLRHNFHQIEQSLYKQLAKTPDDSLNEVRITFLSTGRGTQKRLNAWQKKHLGAKTKLVGELVAEEPAWWGKECHVVPGGNIIVRESDWGSIIAHTLSTPDYHLELFKHPTARSSSSVSQTNTPLTPPPESTPTPSFFSVATGYKLFSYRSRNHPDPDQEGVVWNEPEQYHSVVSRKEPNRDHASLLGMRDILRQKPVSETSSNNGPLPLLVRGLSTSSVQAVSAKAKAKSDVIVNNEAAVGRVSGPDTLDAADLQALQEVTTSRPPSVKSVKTSATPLSALPGEIESAPSVISVESGKSEKTARGGGHPTIASPPPPPPKAFAQKEVKEKATDLSLPASAIKPKTPEAAAPVTSSSLASALAHGINSAVRFVTSAESSSSGGSPSPPSAKQHHHALLLTDIANIDERPHIKYDWIVGKRLKFSCTVYYAKQFDALRRRCGINDLFLRSLTRSVNWSAQGGKSRSNFWKTSDERFIIKSLVNAWNVADLQVLTELAPSYFRYMDATAGKPTVLAKLIGFYTIKIKNLETGVVQSRADLLVMENLFYERNINKTFDLKGIQGRKVKAPENRTKTLFDGEWIEGQQRTPMLVHPHSKTILRDAIRNDTEFLSKSNIMDYSLLLGVDEDKKQIACGLVDTIGSYTFAKTLEYKAKQGLQSGKEVTVVPPAEYRDRFMSALEGYFIACPDKWSKPLDESKIVSDPHLLPSVL